MRDFLVFIFGDIIKSKCNFSFLFCFGFWMGHKRLFRLTLERKFFNRNGNEFSKQTFSFSCPTDNKLLVLKGLSVVIGEMEIIYTNLFIWT